MFSNVLNALKSFETPFIKSYVAPISFNKVLSRVDTGFVNNLKFIFSKPVDVDIPIAVPINVPIVVPIAVGVDPFVSVIRAGLVSRFSNISYDDDDDDTCSIVSNVSFIIDYDDDDDIPITVPIAVPTNVPTKQQCLGITRKTGRCKRIVPTDFCFQHGQHPPATRCQGVKRDGEACQFRKKFGDFCGHHAPKLPRSSTAAPTTKTINQIYKDRILPLFTYQGGKTRLLKQILPLFPQSFNNYFEPFIGGGALAFTRLSYNTHISDLDPLIIGIYTHVKNNFDEFMFHFEVLGNIFIGMENEDLAPAVYELINITTDDIIRSVLYMLMTRCVFRGIIKRSGSVFHQQRFYGRITENMMIKIRDNLERLHNYLQFVDVECCSFESVVRKATDGDFVYLDPPYYYDLGEGHISYDDNNTGVERLIIHDVREVMDEMSRKKVKVMLSMSDYPYVRELFADYHIEEVHIRRSLRAGAVFVSELVIRNYV